MDAIRVICTCIRTVKTQLSWVCLVFKHLLLKIYYRHPLEKERRIMSSTNLKILKIRLTVLEFIVKNRYRLERLSRLLKSTYLKLWTLVTRETPPVTTVDRLIHYAQTAPGQITSVNETHLSEDRCSRETVTIRPLDGAKTMLTTCLKITTLVRRSL